MLKPQALQPQKPYTENYDVEYRAEPYYATHESETTVFWTQRKHVKGEFIFRLNSRLISLEALAKGLWRRRPEPQWTEEQIYVHEDPSNM